MSGTRMLLLAGLIGIVVVALGVRAIDRAGDAWSLHDSALTTAEEVRRENAALSIQVAQLHEHQHALEAYTDSLAARTQETDQRAAAASARADAAQGARLAAWRALDSARTAHDSLVPLIAAVAAGDATTDARQLELAAAYDAIAFRDSTIATQQHLVTLLTTERDSLELQRARDATARAQLVAALRASTPTCRILPGVPCPSRTISAAGGAIVTVLAFSLLRR